ncbi:MAG TPA: c-type cytochrome [Fimbriiglobus sp.]|jgi:putative heme-binding domain-containing protein|nr:c-type cytochrome [Fimbriiglobus sp.]
MTRSLSALLLAVAAGLTLTLVAPTPPADAAPQKGKGKAKGKGKGQPAVPARPQAATPANTLKVAKGFAVELLYSVPKDVQGSWVNLCTDPRGRLIVSDQYGGLFRVTPPPLGQTAGVKIEPIPVALGEAQGLLWAFDSLYVVVNRGRKYESGLYRVTDTNGDDTLDKVELLRKLTGGGEHGPHAVLPHPDGKRLTIICGNQTKLTDVSSSKSSRLWGEDHILPRVPDGNGFMKGVLAPGGYICNVTPDGKEWELVSTGFRNQYDAGYNRAGELFTYDADMEWDFNTPWYRPTRVCHVTSGSEWGWRNGAGKYPPYYPDNLPPVVDVGPGSPTGVCFGYGAKFPQKYQDAFFICDWSYGKLYAVHLAPNGSTYKGEIEEFVTGTPLPLTDVIVNPTDGAMYFAIGGRQTQSGLYRVTYTGTESATPVSREAKPSEASATRHQLEAFHGKPDAKAVEAAWPHLGSKDRFIRFAARTALEHQPADQWTSKALEEKDPQAAITALLGLVRKTAKDPQHMPENERLLHPADAKLGSSILRAFNQIAWDGLTPEQKLELTRVYQVFFVRYGKTGAAEDQFQVAQARFAGVFPTGSRYLDGEICQLLVFMDNPDVVKKAMKLLADAPTQEEQLEYAKALRMARVGWTPELRKDYFSWFVKAGGYKGGNSFRGFLKLIKGDAVALLSPAEKTSLQPVLDAQPETNTVSAAPPRAFVKQWTINELAPVVEKGLSAGGRDFDRGRKLFGAVNCFACHRYDNEGGSAGPDLSGVAGRFNTRDLLESLLDPSKEVSDQYAAVEIDTLDGKKVVGRIVNLNGDNLAVNTNMLDPNGIVNVNRNVVDTIKPSKTSMMPTGLLDTLNESEVLDLMAYLLSRGDRNGPMFKK